MTARSTSFILTSVCHKSFRLNNLTVQLKSLRPPSWSDASIQRFPGFLLEQCPQTSSLFGNRREGSLSVYISRPHDAV